MSHRVKATPLARAHAGVLRERETPPEASLWHPLRNRQLGGFKFRHQYAVGRYIADFFCLSQRVVVEIDGGQHAIRREQDRERDRFLNAQGFRVLRVSASDIPARLQDVLQTLLRELSNTAKSGEPAS